MFITTDLCERIKLGMHHLVVNFDESGASLPWFDVRLVEEGEAYREHYECFDTAHVPGRCLDALLYGEAVTGVSASARAIEIYRRHHLNAFQARDGLNGYVNARTGRRTILFHNLREGLLGLNALVAWRNDDTARELAERMIAVITDLTGPDGTWRADRLDALREQADIEIGAPPAVTGRLVEPLLRFARLTGHDPARELAMRLADHVDRVAFDEKGRLTEQAGGHVHSITSTISGLCLLAAESRDEARLRRAAEIYENAPAPWRSSFGWVKELIGPPHLGGEVNSTGDLIQAAIILARAGVPALYADAETMLRGHLLPSQVMGEGAIASAWTRGAQVGDPAQDEIVSSMLGGFGFPTPSDRAPRHYDEPYVRITTLDITAGAVQAMCRSLESATERVGDDLRIHLLLDRYGPEGRFRMLDLNAGLYEMECGSDAAVEVRLPHGSVQDRARFTPFGGGSLRLLEGRPGYVRIEGRRGVTGYLSMPPTFRRVQEVLVGSAFDVEYVGEQLTSVTPTGPISPITGLAACAS